MADARMPDEFSSELAAFLPTEKPVGRRKKSIEAHFARRCQRRATGHSHGTGECQRPHSHSSSILPVVADFLEIGGKPGPPRKHLMSSTPIAVTTATRLGIGFVRTYSFLYRSFLPGYQLLTPIREFFHIP